MSDVTILALAQLRGVPSRALRALLDRYATSEKLLEAAKARDVGDPSETHLLSLIRDRLDLSKAEKELQRIKKLGAWMRGYDAPGYPKRLAEIADPPLVLFGKGELPPDDAVLLGFVGPRKPSTYGARVARLLAEDLAAEGVVLVSGLARGIDAIAHEAALKKKMPTVAVIACGLDRAYPPEHAHLQDRIAHAGAVVTEFFLGEPPERENFPRRNRLISGLSMGVLLVEASEKSGARITARHATEQAREIFAVPGPIDSPLSFWPNQLIADGAKLVASSADVLEGLVPGYRRGPREGRNAGPRPELSPEAGKLLRHLSLDEPVTAEDLAKVEGVAVGNVLKMLMELEMKGIVERRPDARYVRVAE